VIVALGSCGVSASSFNVSHPQRRRARPSFDLVIGGYAYTLEASCTGANPIAGFGHNGSLKESAEGIDWQRWGPKQSPRPVPTRHPVLVDFTADGASPVRSTKRQHRNSVCARQAQVPWMLWHLLGDYNAFPGEHFGN